MFRTHPVSAMAAILALSLGIGASTTMFSIVHGGTRNLPFDDPESIVAVERLAAGPNAQAPVSLREYQLWVRDARAFDGLGAFQSRSLNISGDDAAPERVPASAVTPGSFELLPVRPAVGRAFLESDSRPGADAVVVLSHALWTRRYRADSAVLGTAIRLDGRPHTIVGVMPARFRFPINAWLWTALPVAGDEPVQVFGRLARGTAPAAAQAELEALARGAAGTTASREATRLNIIEFVELETPRHVRWGLYLLLLAVSGILVIACVNVANLFIVRAVARARDVAIRLALGANRGTIVLEQCVEALALSAIGALIGLAMAWVCTRMFRLATADILEAFWMDFRLDGTVVFYAATLAFVAAVAAAVLPALRVSRSDVVSSLRDGGMGTSGMTVGRLTRGLLGGQVALACALLAFTLLLGSAAVALYSRPWPFDPDSTLTAQIGVPQSVLDDDDARARVLNRLEEGLRGMTGTSTALASVLPGRGAGNWTFSFDGSANDPGQMASTGLTLVSPSYFDTLGGRILRGRGLTAADRPGALPVAVVNESFARRFGGNRDLLGHRLFIGRRDLTIVGVVSDLMSGDVDEQRQDGIYASIHQLRPYAVRVLARGPSDPHALLQPMRAAMARVDPDLPIYETFTVRESALRDKQILGVLSGLFGVFGAGALLITAIGLYSVMAFSVAQRRREMGIRLALGASRRNLVGLFAVQVGRQLAIGLAAGTVLGYGLTRGFRAAVDFSGGNPPLVLAAVVVCLLITAALATAGPALSASSTDPVKALRD